MAIVNFNSIPTSNETGCFLYVFGCGPSGDLPPGGATVLIGSSPGLMSIQFPPVPYYWVGQNRTLSTPTFAQFTLCTPTSVILTIFTPGAARIELELQRDSTQDASVAEEMETALARMRQTEPESGAS